METQTLGRVLTKATIENINDVLGPRLESPPTKFATSQSQTP